MAKRIFLFLLTNVLVIVTLSLVTTLLGLHQYLTAQGLDYKSLAIFCAIWGTGGAFISLFMSKWVAKSAMGLTMIDPNTASGAQRAVLDMVYRVAKKAGLTVMPEVGIYEAPELNAFATGPSQKNALVAVSTGLLANMDNAEVEAVLGHEISHVTNGDMVTMTLIQGIVNAFSLFLSRIIAYAISVAIASRDQQDSGPSFGIFYMLSMLFDVIFTLFGSLVVAAFSRHREYRADLGGARLAGKNQMIAALQRLELNSKEPADNRAPSLAALKISQKSSWLQLFSSHPPLENRIERLRALKD